MRERVNEFSDEVRLQVREDQDNRCALCGGECVGHDMQIHHKVPVSKGGTAERQNAVGLCRRPRLCHELFDVLALKHNIFFDEVIMDIGVEYSVGIQTEKLPRCFAKLLDTNPKVK